MQIHSQAELMRLVRQVAIEVVAPRAEEIDRDARWPIENFRALQSAGLGGLVVPESLGGLGFGLSALACVSEELALACPSTALGFAMHHVASAVIAAKASREQTTRFLDPICRGEHLTTLALSEPGSGAHFYVPETAATRGASGALTITGVKSFVTSGGHADSYVLSVAAVGGSEADFGKFSCVVVPRGASNVTWGPQWSGLGMRGNDSRTMELSEVAVESGHLLGKEGDQIWYVFNVVAPYFLVAMAGTYLGIATAALEEARRHLVARKYTHNGSSLAQQPVLQHRFGVLWAKVARTRAFLHHAAAAGEAGADDALPALCSAKAEVAECAVDVVNETMTLLGGKGFAAGSRIHRMLRDARAAHVMAPTTDLLRMWTGRIALDLPLLSE